MDERILKIKTPTDMLEILRGKGRLLKTFKKGDTITVWNKMEKSYSYTLDETPGHNFAPDFKPWASPGEMLKLGVFQGKYLNDCLLEFPAEWFLDAIKVEKLQPTESTVSINYMKADSRLTLGEWRRKGWVPGSKRPDSKGILSDAKTNPDERGWFQWYCRYWMGRRLPDLDAEQIRRWRAFKRHAGGVKANCEPHDLKCRPRQRQALLQWAWNPRI